MATDSMLSRRANIAELEGRDLEAVAASWLAPETSAKLDRGHTRLPGGWNQFEVNRRLYNVQDTFDENLYTKRLDKSSLTREQQDRADRIAHQIEKSTTTNIHLQEERGQLGDSLEIDEEDMYSGVIRQSSSDGGVSVTSQTSLHSAGSTTGSASPGASGPGSGGNRGFGRGSGSPGGAWRRVDAPPGHSPGPAGGKHIKGSTSPTVSGGARSGNKSTVSTAGGGGGSPRPVGPSSSDSQGENLSAATTLPKMSSPALPPGLSHDSADSIPITAARVDGGGAVESGLDKDAGGHASPSAPTHTSQETQGTSSPPSVEVSTAPSGDTKTDGATSVSNAAPAAPAPPKSSLNAAATAFVPSFAMKSSPSTATPTQSTPTSSVDHSHSHGGGRGGGRGKNRGGHKGGRGGHYGGGHHPPHFDQYGGGGGYGVMPGPMGYDMGNGGYPSMQYGPPMQPMGYGGGIVPAGYYPPPQPGYFMPPPGPHMPFDGGGYGGGGMMPGGGMGYDGGAGGAYFGMQQGHAPPGGGSFGGGAVPVAAGLGNISISGPNASAGDGEGK